MSDVVGPFRDVAETNLRVVARLESLDYEVVYVREDLSEEYGEADFDRAYQSMMANQVSTDDFSRVGPFGTLESQLFLFENIIVFLFPSSRYSGLFVSFDRTESFPFMAVVDTAKGVMERLGETVE